MSVYVSTGAFQTRNIRELFQIAMDYDIRRIELSAGLSYASDTLDTVREFAKKGFCFLIHNYFPAPEKEFVLNLASNDVNIVRQSVSMCKHAIDLAAELGIPFYSLHCGFTFDAAGMNLGNASQMQLPRIAIDKAKKIFVENISEICQYAARRQLKIAIENNVLAEFASGQNDVYLGVTPEDLLEILDMAGQPNLGVLLDLAHAQVSNTFLGFGMQRMLDMLDSHIIAVHVSENDGWHDQNLPLGENSSLIQYICQLCDRDVVLEAYGLSPDTIKAQTKLLERGVTVG